jgi:hypothetical protein
VRVFPAEKADCNELPEAGPQQCARIEAAFNMQERCVLKRKRDARLLRCPGTSFPEYVAEWQRITIHSRKTYSTGE